MLEIKVSKIKKNNRSNNDSNVIKEETKLLIKNKINC